MDKKIVRLCVIWVMIGLAGCTPSYRLTETPYVSSEEVVYPTPAATLPELVENLLNGDPMVRYVSRNALADYGEEAVVAVPDLIENLSHQDWNEVRIRAAKALGRIGSSASEAVPHLISIVENEKEDYQFLDEAIRALGEIGNKSAVPALAFFLYEDDERFKKLTPNSAMSIAQITGERFTDSENYGFIMTQDGEFYIVPDARKWWEQEGKYQDWGGEE